MQLVTAGFYVLFIAPKNTSPPPPPPHARAQHTHTNTHNLHFCPLPFSALPCHHGDRYASVMADWRVVHLNDSSGTAVEWWSAVASLINFQSSLQYSHSAPPSPQPSPTFILPSSLPPTTYPHLHPITLSINNMPIKIQPVHSRCSVCTQASK